MTAAKPSQSPTAAPLVEREAELATLDGLVEEARTGAGRTVIIRGPPGIGKTRLLRELRSRAEAAGLTTLTARGGELERDFAFGCVRQLFEPIFLGSRERRAALLNGDARLSEAVFLPPAGDAPGSSDAGYGALHGLYWLTANLAERTPLLLALDDAHWADPASLRYLHFLARRLEGVPALLALSVRSGERGPALDALRDLSPDPSTSLLELDPLSESGVGETVRARVEGEVPDRICALCHEATGGNPFLLGELLRELGPTGAVTETDRIEALGPEGVAEAILARLERVGERAPSLARAVAVLGDGAELRAAAALAELDPERAASIADQLGDADILEPERPLHFVHPIVRNAVYNQMHPGERERWHRRAAALLADGGEPAESVALHLLASDPAARSEVVDVLQEAADAASSRGALDAAVRYLERALAEPPPAAARAEVMCALGRSAGLLGDPRALDWLREGVHGGGGSPAGVEAAIWFTSAVAFAGSADEALTLGRQALSQADVKGDLTQRLECALLGLGQISPSVRPPVRELVRRNLDAALAGEDLAPGFLGNAAIECALSDGDSERSAALAERAIERGVVDEVGHDEPGPSFTIGALVVTERFEGAERVAADVLTTARTRGNLRYVAAALALRAWSRYRQGRLIDVRADAELYPDFMETPVTDAMIAGPQVQALIDAGELERAAQVAAPVAAAPFDPGLTAYQRFAEGHAALRLAQGDPTGALEITRRMAGWEEAVGQRSGAWVPWRSQAALAHAALGEREEAIGLAEEQVALASRFGTPGMLGSALRAMGLVRGGEEGIAALREACEALAGSAFRLEHARALVDLGAALRGTGQPAEARELLRDGLDRAHRCGAVALADRALEELVATGARPRRPLASDADALTPSERRVAEMAAEGMSNKEIAQALFVTVNTVETHLRHAYRKLGIKSRAQLAGRLVGVLVFLAATAERLCVEVAAPV